MNNSTANLSASSDVAPVTPGATHDTVDAQQRRRAKAYRLGLMVYLLQGLHFLFAITAIIGMLVNHTNQQHVQGTYVQSHFRWQIVSFWVLAPAYALTFYVWVRTGHWWPILLVFAIVAFRLVRGWWQLLDRKPVGNFW